MKLLKAIKDITIGLLFIISYMFMLIGICITSPFISLSYLIRGKEVDDQFMINLTSKLERIFYKLA
jgi:hypothetical protein